MPYLWTNLDFGKAKRPLSLGAIKQYVKWGNKLATSVTLPYAGRFAQGVPHYITTRCKNLGELRVLGGLVGETIVSAASCAANLTCLILGSACEVGVDTADQLLTTGRFLERVEFHAVVTTSRQPMPCPVFELSKLHTLVINVVMKFHPLIPDWARIVRYIPNVRTLALRLTAFEATPRQRLTSPRLDKLEQLEELYLGNIISHQHLRLPSSLRKLHLYRCDFAYAIMNDNYFTQLLSVSIDCIPEDALATWKMIIDGSSGSLTHLRISACLEALDWFAYFLPSNKLLNVVELDLGTCQVDDDLAELIADGLPALKRVSLRSTNITGVGVKSFITHSMDSDGLSRLEFLGLDHCSRCSADAIEYARSKGVETSYKCIPDLGGRRIRDF